MNIAKIIQIKKSGWDPRQQSGGSAAVGNSGTRSLALAMTEGVRPWRIPEGVRAALVSRNAAGCSGAYDTISDGRPADPIRRNQLRMELARLNGMLKEREIIMGGSI